MAVKSSPNTLSEAWWRMAEEVYSELDEVTLQEFRVAFYAGALMLDSMSSPGRTRRYSRQLG